MTALRYLPHMRHALRRAPSLRCWASSSAKPADIESLLSEPVWSVKSLLPDAIETANGLPTVSRAQLHHLLRLSALPQPSSQAEEDQMLKTLGQQIHFVKAMQRVDTSDPSITPLRAIRDESSFAEQENEIGVDDLKDALSREKYVGRARRVERAKPAREARPDGEAWDGDALRHANKTVGGFFVVQGGGKGEN
ncbi:hypothetical protein KEM55_000970 [Ascosphaera atra]|nr:hypothetical protein KEM55_000970 [Ascosphaera atra]